MGDKRVVVVGVVLAALVSAMPAHAASPQVAGLQVALRAYGLYQGPIDAIAGPQTIRATAAFQRRAGLAPDGRAGPRTRAAFGPLGRPLFGRRTLRRGMFGWDVSVLQFLLESRGALVPVDGYFDGATERALRRYQRERRLGVDGIAGRITFAALSGHRPAAPRPSRSTGTGSADVRALLVYWAGVYGVRQSLVRALAWMESGYTADLVSSVGARGALQVLPVTHRYVERFVLGRRIPRTTSGEIQAGVLYLRQLLREFHGNTRRALAAWYQGPASVRRHGPFRVTHVFVTDVLALERRNV